MVFARRESSYLWNTINQIPGLEFLMMTKTSINGLMKNDFRRISYKVYEYLKYKVKMFYD